MRAPEPDENQKATRVLTREALVRELARLIVELLRARTLSLAAAGEIEKQGTPRLGME
jgi:hypothetical protein